jgi:hypothetical protein
VRSQIFARSIGLLILASCNIAMAFLPADIPTLEEFAAAVQNGQPGQVVGIYVPQVLALKVVQQAANNPVQVTENPGDTTQFSLATQYGSIGLLAHNYLSGALFFNLMPGQEVNVIYGDGSIRRYTIAASRRFQALSPTDPASDFVDLDDNSSTRLSNAALFDQIYASGDQVIFQTCIHANGNPSWGRLFVIATPASDQMMDQSVSLNVSGGDHPARRKAAAK